jgi:hypothetical protein
MEKQMTRIYKAKLIMEGLEYLGIPGDAYGDLRIQLGGQDELLKWVEKQIAGE